MTAFKVAVVQAAPVLLDREATVAKATELADQAAAGGARLVLFPEAFIPAYPRELNYAKMKAIADEVGAVTVADMAHIAGLIAGKALRNPFHDGFDVITTTTHKTLRGPRGGMILCREAELGKKIDKSVFPGFQGGPIMQMIAAKAVAFGEALKPEFREYAKQVIVNSKHLAAYLMSHGVKLVTNGTDNHLMLIDCVQSWNVGGGEVETLLDSVGITLNKNMIANDTRKPMDPSGVRLGTPAITTRGMKEKDMETLADFMLTAVKNRADASALKKLHEEVKTFCLRFPVPGITAEDH